MANKFDKILNEYLDFLKEKKIYKKDLAIEYEHSIEKLHNWLANYLNVWSSC